MRNVHLILVLATSLLSFTTAQAAPADVPETGQTTCYNNFYAVTACATTGQDGDHLAGVAWPSTRFTVGTGVTAPCVTDNLTGLMWMGTPSVSNTWMNALTAVNGLTLCGFSDWRLPNINELESLVNREAANPAAFLNTQGFTVQADFSWSSSSYAGDAANAWAVDTIGGGVSSRNKINSHYVWPVRAGQ